MIFDKNWNCITGEQLMERIKEKEIIVFGASPRNDGIFRVTGAQGIRCIYDNDPKKWGTVTDGLTILQPETDANAVILTAVEAYRQIVPQFAELGYEETYYFMREELYEKRYKGYISFYMQAKREYRFDSRIKNAKVFHVVLDDKFFLPVVDLIERAFCMEEHLFLVYGFNGPNHDDKYGNWKKDLELSEKYGNVMIIDSQYNLRGTDCAALLETCRPILRDCGKILFHGEWLDPVIREFFAESENKKRIRQKGIWIPWSGSVGTDRQNEQNIEEALKYCKVIASSDDFTYDRLCRYVRMPEHVRFGNGFSYAWITDRPKPHRKGRNILLGQSCFWENYNLESLRALAKFKTQIDVWCITSYGEADCVEAVKKEGENIFGDRFHAMDAFLPYPQFVAFLNRMDAAVYGMEIAYSFDTLYLLFWLKKKVYLKKGSEAAGMMQSLGFCPSDFYRIADESIEEVFYNPAEEDNYKASEREFDRDRKISQWRELFDLDVERLRADR